MRFRIVRKGYRRRKSTKPMARRRGRRSSRRYSGFVGRTRRVGRGMLSSFKSGAIGQGVRGVGGGVVAEEITARVAPQYSDIAGFVGAYASGGPMGVAGHVVRKIVSGQLAIPGLGGGGGGASEAI